MPDRNRDVRIRILSEYYDEGSKAAERAMRRNANLQIQAQREDMARESQRAAELARANAAQASAMESWGRRTLAVTAAVAVGLGLATKSAMDWESAWAGVRKTVDGSDEEMAVLEGQLRGLARVLPATHEEIAAVAEAAGQLGVQRQDVAAFTRTMIDMGQSTNLSADEAATSMAQFSNIMGIGADQAGRLGSSIVALGNNSATTERDILAMGLRIAGAGRSVGLTADQVMALAASLASVGIPAEAGGTAISKVMLQIDKDIAGGTDAVEKYAKVAGVSAREFAAHWRNDAASALTAFTQGLGRIQDAGQNTAVVLDDLGFSEVRTSDALRRMALSGDVTTDSLKLSSEAWAENIALTEEAGRRYETTESKLAIARNQINDAAIDIGANFLPAVGSAAEAVGSLATGFGELPPEAQKWVAGLGAASVGLGTVVGGAAVAIPKLVELRKTLDALQGGSSRMGRALGGVTSFLTGPWGLALAGAVVATGIWLKRQGDARKELDAYVQSLDAATGALTTNTRELVFNALMADGTIDKAKALGLELSAVIDAALDPSSAAYQQLAADAEVAADRVKEISGENVNLFASGLNEAAGVANKYKDVLLAVAGQTDVVNDAQREHADRVAAGVVETEAATDAASDYNVELGDQADAAEEASKALDELSRALSDLNNPTLSAREAERRFQAAIDDVTKAIKDNGTSLDITTEKGRRNQETLDGLARSGLARAQAVLEETGSVDDFNASLQDSREALLRAAEQYGLTEEEARAYIDSVLAIPDSTETKAILDTEDAEIRMERYIAAYTNRQITISIVPDVGAMTAAQRNNYGLARTAHVGMGNATGHLLEFYAAGGLRPMDPVAQMVPANTWRVVGDRPDVPEAFIPLDGSRRSLGILEQSARHFGQVLTRADQIPWGPAPAAPASARAPLTVEVSANSPWAEALAAKIATRVVDVTQLHEARRLIGAGS